MFINYLNCSLITLSSYQHFRYLVSEQRRARADTYRKLIDSIRCIYSEVLLRYSLKKFYQYEKAIEISFNEYGKPNLANPENLYFNISHAGNWLVLAMGGTEVGIDLEEINPFHISDLRNVFTEDDKKFLFELNNEERIEKTCSLWTMKESYVKYLRTGMYMDLTSFSIKASSNKDNTDYEINYKANTLETKKPNLLTLLLDSNLYLSVCSQDDEYNFSEVRHDKLEEEYL